MTEMEKLTAKLLEIKAEQKKAVDALNIQIEAQKAEIKRIEAEAKKAKADMLNANETEKMRKFAELVAKGAIELKENKKEMVLWCMIRGYCKDAIMAYTGYTNKEVTDMTWAIYESNGCNPDR